jgi:hypothetical protein
VTNWWRSLQQTLAISRKRACEWFAEFARSLNFHDQFATEICGIRISLAPVAFHCKIALSTNKILIRSQNAMIFSMTRRPCVRTPRHTVVLTTFVMAALGGCKLSSSGPSPTRFLWDGRQVEFVKDAHGKVTHLTWPTPEGEAKAFRKQDAN